MGTLASELDTKSFTSNVVVKFLTRAKFFAIHTPDADVGSLIDSLPAAQKGLKDPKLNPISLSIVDAKTSFQTFSFSVTDVDLAMTAEMSGNENLWMNELVEIHIGRIGVAMDFADYFTLPTLRIRSVSYSKNEYKFTAESIDATFQVPTFEASATLNADTSATAGTLVMSENISTDFPAAGKIFIDDGENSEVLAYSSYTSATFTLTGTTAKDHSEGIICWDNETITGNPIDIAMQMITGGTDTLEATLNGSHGALSATLTATGDLTSWAATGCIWIEDTVNGSEFVEYNDITGQVLTLVVATVYAHDGGETMGYCLRDGLNVSRLLFDMTEIEGIRDEFFSGDSFTLEMNGSDKSIGKNTLTWLQDQLFLPNNLRFIAGNASGLYSFSVLDQLGFAGTSITFDSTNVVGQPKFSTSNRNVKTKVRMNYGYNANTDTYANFLESTNTSALANYGATEPFIIDCKGCPDDAAGAILAADRVARWLERVSTTRPMVTLKTHFSEFDANLGTGVLVTLALPDATGTLAYSQDLEVQKRSIDLKKGLITWELSSTSETGLRTAYISPSDLVVSVPTTTTITVASGRGALYDPNAKGDWVMNFFVNNSDTTAGNTTGTIASVATDTITFTAAHGLSIGHRVKFANYDQIGASQKRYSSIIDDALSVFASDGLTSYKVVF